MHINGYLFDVRKCWKFLSLCFLNFLASAYSQAAVNKARAF